MFTQVVGCSYTTFHRSWGTQGGEVGFVFGKVSNGSPLRKLGLKSLDPVTREIAVSSRKQCKV